MFSKVLVLKLCFIQTKLRHKETGILVLLLCQEKIACMDMPFCFFKNNFLFVTMEGGGQGLGLLAPYP